MEDRGQVADTVPRSNERRRRRERNPARTACYGSGRISYLYTQWLLIPVSILYLCLAAVTTSFVPLATRTRSRTMSHLSSSSVPDNEIITLKANFISRRATLATLASAALFPSLAAQAATTAGPLESILLGEGRWEPLSRSPVFHDDSSFSASFCTYAVRLLIQYDTGVRAWWTELESSLRQLKKDQTQAKLGRAFGSFAKSLERAFEGTSSSDLYDYFARSYGEQPDAARQIALLFTLLPDHQQPISRLQSYFDSFKAAPISKLTAPALSKKVPTEPTYVSSTTTALFGDNLTRLLPAIFHIKQHGNSFLMEPAITLYEVGIGEEFGQTALATAFGPLASAPLMRETPVYALETYALFGLSGATGCVLTHAAVIPLDVLKTRAQTDPVLMNSGTQSGPMSMLDAGLKIVENEGIEALLLGAQATIAGYFWYGLSVYPSYAFIKRYLSYEFYPLDYAVAHANEIALIAGAGAAVIASLGLTPLEAARIRVVADPAVYKPLGLTGTIGVIAKEDPILGWANLYAGLPSLLTRQVIFGSIKFLAFERACELLFALWPFLRDATWTSLAVSLVAGGLSGVISSVVSQPADSMLTYVSKDSSKGGRLGLVDGARQMVAEDGAGSLFRGLGSRCVWAGSIIAGQFLLYDVFRTFFRVSADDLSQIYELILDGR